MKRIKKNIKLFVENIRNINKLNNLQENHYYKMIDENQYQYAITDEAVKHTYNIIMINNPNITLDAITINRCIEAIMLGENDYGCID